jgi:hypothetical protein
VEREVGEELRGAKAIWMESLTEYRCGGRSLVTRVSFGVLLRQMKVVEHIQHHLTTNPVPGERLMSTAFWRHDVEKSKTPECLQPTEADIVRLPDSAIARSRHCKWIFIEWQEHDRTYNNYYTYNHPAIWFGGLNPHARLHVSHNHVGSEWCHVQSYGGQWGGYFEKRETHTPVDIDLRLLFRELSGYTLEMKSNARLQEDKALVTIEREKEDRKKRMVAFVVAVLAIAVATAGVCLLACNIII